jgi:RNA polymerase sigma-70 factor (ECF subfamily)
MTPALPDARSRFTAIYDEHYHRVLGYALRRLRRDDAQDVVAETFAVAWRRLEKVPEGDETLYWLYATARRVTANHLRAERRRRSLGAAVATELATTPTTEEASEARQPRAAAALRSLSADDRELLLLLAWEGLDAGGVARTLGCSRNAARIRIHRARRRFAAALAATDAPKRAPSIPDPRLRLEDIE